MLYMPIAGVPDSLREFILRCSDESCRAFESLKAGYDAAVRNKQFAVASQISAQLAKYMRPSNPAIFIVGGSGGYVLVDEKQIPLATV